MLSLREIATALGGDASGKSAVVPGPGHSPKDRSLSITPADNQDGFICYSFAGDDHIGCKDYVREKLGLPAFQPSGQGASHASEDYVAKRFAAALTAPPVKDEPTKPDNSAKARNRWSMRWPIEGSIAERYLRDCRGYRGPLPQTLGFVPASGGRSPAMIAAFGFPDEPEPGRLLVDDNAVTAVHFTQLRPDGSGKAGTSKDKYMLGPAGGQPIVLRPVNDLGGLLITEGIENALACHASGLGLWAAGSASFLSALADRVPGYVESVTVIVDTDDSGAGLRESKKLGQLLLKRGFEVFLEMEGHRG